jgi:CubicO group peptidase (beta-lactamase class C family)
MFSMNAPRFFLIPISLLLVFAACKQKAVKKIEKVSIDSAAYLAPVPGNIPKQEFDRYFNAVQDYYIHNLVDKGFNGGILVAKKGHVIFEAYHGFFNLKKKDSLTPHSPFHLASVSKTFTAMAALKLVEMGKLNLDDDIKKFFPGFPYDNVTI